VHSLLLSIYHNEKLMTKSAILLLVLLTPMFAFAQKPEHQISFAREMKPHSYYVEQAKLWWQELQKDSLSESNWANYFRASRNAHGTDDWKSDFVKESPYLRQGDDIIKLMKEHIPNTATYLYLSYLNHGVGTVDADNLMKAYRMDPNLEGIHSSVISLAETTLDTTLRREVNKAWFKINYISTNLLTYGYNVLMSLEPNAILLTQNDNDTYPLWMLQDALNLRKDVTVINIDFLLGETYRSAVFKRFGLPAIDLGTIDANVYRDNWSKVVRHILTNYTGTKPLYVGMTLYQELYADFENKLALSGLAFKRVEKKTELTAFNRNLFEHKFLLDSLEHTFFVDQNEGNVLQQNLNYLSVFKELFDDYRTRKQLEQASRLRTLAFAIVANANHPDWTEQIGKDFPE
jgi:hypothetical protein